MEGKLKRNVRVVGYVRTTWSRWCWNVKYLDCGGRVSAYTGEKIACNNAHTHTYMITSKTGKIWIW